MLMTRIASLILTCLLAFLPALHAADGPSDKGLVLWLDATGLSAGQANKWTDKSGKQHHATGTKGPSVLAEKPTLARFGEGGVTSLTTPALSEGRRDFTVFVVARRTAGQAGGGPWQRLLTPAKPAGEKDKGHVLGLSLPPQDGIAGAFPLAVYSKVLRDVDASAVIIGAHFDKPLQADIGELLVYDRAFDDAAEYEQVVDYLCQKWSVNVQSGWDGWERKGPIPPPLARTSDALPLIDQANAGHWQRYEPQSDEFNGIALDATKWWDHNPGWYGRVPAPFMPDNIAIKDGELQLTLRKDDRIKAFTPYKEVTKPYGGYSSASVTSKTALAYGCFEIRAKVAASVTTNAWWFAGDAKNAAGEIFKNEIDVFELQAGADGREDNYGMCLHVFKDRADDTPWRNGANWKAPFKWSDDFHTFTLVWSPQWIRYYVDGHCIRTTRNVAWHAPLRMIFDMEIMDWLPFPPGSEFPVLFRVDYVRAWTRPDWSAAPDLKPQPDPAKETAVTRKVRELLK